MTASARRLALAGLLVGTFAIATPPPAEAFNPLKPICSAGGLVSGVVGKVCTVASRAPKVLGATKKLLSGHLGQALHSLTGAGGAVRALGAAAAFAAAGAWVMGGARAVLRETSAVIASTTRPELESTWFSSSYWRMAAIAALLTLPFLFAACVQAVMRSDLSLLVRSALGYLPLGLLAISVAAPITQLLLSASDELSRLVSSASDYSSTSLSHLGFLTAAVSGLSGSAFPLFFVGLLAVAATLTLWVELLVRAAAVYVIVLMLPLFFAAMVWPARRIWVTRALEVLLALILSKFAIVAVLSLGGAALGHTTLPSLAQMLAGTTLVMLAAFSPWALLRLLPLHELASGLEGLRHGPGQRAAVADLGAQGLDEWTESVRHRLPEAVSAQADDAETPRGPQAARAGLGEQRWPTPGEASEAAPEAGDEPDPGPEVMAGATGGSESTMVSEPDASEPVPRTAEHPPADAEAGAPRGPAPDPDADRSSERLPGMDAPWQRANGDWPFVLGPEGLAEDPEQPEEPDPSEDTDPLPPAQDPDDGIL